MVHCETENTGSCAGLPLKPRAKQGWGMVLLSKLQHLLSSGLPSIKKKLRFNTTLRTQIQTQNEQLVFCFFKCPFFCVKNQI